MLRAPTMISGQDADAEDQALLIQARAGSVSAFEQLVVRHRDRVYALAHRMLRSEADAAEVVQDTFLSAWQALPTFRGETAFAGWVARIGANQSLMRLRHRKVVTAAVDALTGPGFEADGHLAVAPAPQWSRPPDAHALQRELGQAIRQATDALPEGYREVFLLKDVEGLSYEEIGELTGISVAAVKSRLRRARLALREDIDRFYREH